MVKLYGQDLRFDHLTGRWLIWDTHWWKPDANGLIYRYAKRCARARGHFASGLTDDDDADTREAHGKHAHRSESAGAIESSVKLLKTEMPVACGEDIWDADPFLLGVLNGVMDLRTGTKHDGRRPEYITKHAEVEYHPTATCPVYDAFMEQIMDNDHEMIDFIHRLLGMCLTGDISEQIISIFWGGGGNGKNTLLDAVCGIMGSMSTPAPPKLLTAKSDGEHDTQIADLIGRRLVIASESKHSEKLPMPLIKRLTGDEWLKGRFMRGDYLTFRRSFKLILVTNPLPTIDEDTHAVWRRILLVPFTVQIKKVELNFGKRLVPEWPGIFNVLLRGCLDWQKNGLNPPEKVLHATQDYRDDSSKTRKFFEDTYEEGEGNMLASQLYGEYTMYCAMHGFKPDDILNDVPFGRAISPMFPKVKVVPEGVVRYKKRVGKGIMYFGLKRRT